MFVGTVFFVFKPDSPNWPNEHHFLNTWPVNDGAVTMWTAPDQTFIAVFKPKDGAAYWIQTSPLIFDTADWEFRIALRFNNEDADVFVNGQLAATNRDGIQQERQINISALENVAPGFDRSTENEDCRIARKKEVKSLVTRGDRRMRTLDEEVKSLRDGCKQLEDLLQMVSKGQIHFETAISSRLRALICRFDRGPSFPLLQRVAGVLGLPLILYAPPFDGLNDEHPLVDGLAFNILNMVTSEPSDPIQVPLDIDVWLKLRHATIDGKAYSNNQILRAIADTSGSHYDAAADPLVDYLSNIKTLNAAVSAANRLLVNVSQCVIFLGNFVLREVTSNRSSSLNI